MTVRVALHHETLYRFDRPVTLAPHEVRLRPAPHCRTPILSYSLKINPREHSVGWRHDAYGNDIARLTFPKPTGQLEINVDLVAEMTAINPFDFFIEDYAERFPFRYTPQLTSELAPYLEQEPPGLLLQGWLDALQSDQHAAPINTVDFLVLINQKLQRDIRYLVRLDPGIQTPDETLRLGSGSCRDSGWLLVRILRQLGLPARFVSGYLIQLAADRKPLDGPAGPAQDVADLHAWAEVYLPGAGWIGLDTTSGLLAGEGHIPLACTVSPAGAAPVTGSTELCDSSMHVAMSVTRIHETGLGR